MRLSRQRVVALLVLTAIMLITLDSRGSTAINRARTVFVEVMAPLQGVGRAITNPIRNTWRGITDYPDLERENDRLRELLALSQGDSIAAQAALRNWQELAAQAGLETVGDYSNVTAQVLTYGASNVRLTVEINKGSDAGIRVGMPVVTGAGLIGKITQVSAKRSVVLLITDPSYSVPVTVSGPQPIPGTKEAAAAGQSPIGGRTTTVGDVTPSASETSVPDPASSDAAAGDQGITALPTGVVDGTETIDGATATDGSVPVTTVVATTTAVPTSSTIFDLSKLSPRETGGLEGRGEGKPPIVRFIASDARGLQIRVGDVVVTNGGSTDLATDLRSLAPADLVIGRVITVTERPGQAGPEVEVEPNADLSRLNFVRVILYVPPTEVPAG